MLYSHSEFELIHFQAKKAIEQDQRQREKQRHDEGKEYEGVYFVCKTQEDGTKQWVYNEKETLNRAFLEYASHFFKFAYLF
jgi:hypothetical protein